MGGASPYHARFIGLQPSTRQGHGGSPSLAESGEKYCGLVNMSNTCYVNSVLQALYFCQPFRKSAIRHFQEEASDPSTSDSLLNSLAELFSQISSQKRSASYITPRRFLARLRKASDLFDNSEHQDAHEFMQFLLNDIAEQLKKKAISDRNALGSPVKGDDQGEEEEPRTWVHDIFQGHLVNQMKCLRCENVSVRRETFLDLSVDIEKHTSIAACLRAFESTELLRAGNKFFCDQCGCLQEAEKRLRIYQLPGVLTLHLKRFKYVERLGRCCRLPYRVIFPLQLRIVEHRPPRRRKGAGGGRATNAGSASPTAAREVGSSEAEADADAELPPSRLFELRSVVVHFGRDPTRGHYVTVVRNGDSCVLLDDDAVRQVEPEVLRSFYGTAGDVPQERSNQRGTGNGWSGSDGMVQERYGQSMPLYERAPEGTCCGYLLFYEAVDRGGGSDKDAGSAVDVGCEAEWISEDRDLNGSDSDGSTAMSARPASAGGQEPARQLGACDDGELTQAFEQRCLPRGAVHSTRRRPSSPGALSVGASPPTSPSVAVASGAGAVGGGR